MQQMKAGLGLGLRTQHLPAKRHHKNVVMHSSVRLPPVQANNFPPPGAARVAAVGAGVVLACALGAMYWKSNKARAFQFPMPRSSSVSQTGEDGIGHGIASADVSIEKLIGLLSKICIRTSDPMPSYDLTDLINQQLTDKERATVKEKGLREVLDKKYKEFLGTKIGDEDIYWGLALSLGLLAEKKYAEAEKICEKLKPIVSPKESRHHLLLAVINVMSMQYPTRTTDFDLKDKLRKVKDEWEAFEEKSKFQAAPPQVTDMSSQ